MVILSIPFADASVLQPMYGMPQNSITPWNVPSSQFVPCKAGSTTSSFVTTSFWNNPLLVR